MLPSRFWYEMPTTHFAGDTSEWIAILPIAAVEQHGPHLPVGVDAIIADEMVARCAHHRYSWRTQRDVGHAGAST